MELHFFYKNKPENIENWKKFQPKTAELLAFFNKHVVGKYPYKQYSVVQGGDGGMEYAMCTLITGNRINRSLVGVTAHEFAHSLVPTHFSDEMNQNIVGWMKDLPFISDLAMNQVLPKRTLESPFADAYKITFILLQVVKNNL